MTRKSAVFIREIVTRQNKFLISSSIIIWSKSGCLSLLVFSWLKPDWIGEETDEDIFVPNTEVEANIASQTRPEMFVVVSWGSRVVELEQFDEILDDTTEVVGENVFMALMDSVSKFSNYVTLGFLVFFLHDKADGFWEGDLLKAG